MPPGATDPRAMWNALRRQWSALAPAARRNIVLAAVAVAAGVLLLAVLQARGPAMGPLFTNLSPTEGAAIIQQLGKDKVPYRLAANGGTILVPQSQVDKLRLEMAGLGLPKSGSVGLSSVLSLPFGATNFTDQVAYQNALQNELENTINEIHGVSGSRVQIVLPQSQTFSGQTAPASAAVLVQLQSGVTLSSSQVRGIANLVAASVQGLTPAGVTVLNQTGQILWTQGGTTASGTAGGSGTTSQAASALQLNQQFDQQLQTNLQQMLEQVFGPGNVVTQVQAQLDLNTGTVDKTLFEPAGSSPPVVASMQRLQQAVSGTGGTGGVPGTASNSIPTYPASSTSASGSSTTSNQVTTNYDVSKETEHTVVAPGTVSHLSVAVVINSALSAAQLALVRSTVQAAVGAVPASNDQITVVGLPFNHSLASALSKVQPQPAPPLSVPLPVLVAGGALLLVLLAVLLLSRRRRSGPVSLGDSAPAADGMGATLPPRLLNGSADADALDGAIAAAQAARDRMHSTLRQRPEDVARVVRVWLDHSE